MSRSGKISPTHVPLPSQGTCASPLLYVRLKDFLYEEYGARLRGVVLYGSEARGEATPTSDIDVLVLLDGPVRFGEELRRVSMRSILSNWRSTDLCMQYPWPMMCTKPGVMHGAGARSTRADGCDA